MGKLVRAGAFALAIGAAVITAPRASMAELLIQYDISINGGASSGLLTLASGASGGTVAGTVTFDGVTLRGVEADSNSPGDAIEGILESSSLSIQNTGAAGAAVTIIIGDTGFTAPVTPPPIDFFSNIGGVVTIGSPGNSLSYTSCISTTDAQNACPGDFSTAALTPDIKLGNTSFEESNFTPIPSLSENYSVTEEFTINVGAGTPAVPTKFNFGASSDVDPVPEPASLLLLGVSLLGMGVLRRRKSA